MDQPKKFYSEKSAIKDVTIEALLRVQPDSAYIFYTDSHWFIGKVVIEDEKDFLPTGYLFLKDARVFTNSSDSRLPRLNKDYIRLNIDKIIAFQQISEESL